jgi:hypothetical protein
MYAHSLRACLHRGGKSAHKIWSLIWLKPSTSPSHLCIPNTHTQYFASNNQPPLDTIVQSPSHSPPPLPPYTFVCCSTHLYCFWYIWPLSSLSLTPPGVRSVSLLLLLLLLLSISTSHFFHYSEMDNTYAHKMWAAAAATKHSKKDEKDGWCGSSVLRVVWDGKSINENCLFQISHFSFPCVLCTDARSFDSIRVHTCMFSYINFRMRGGVCVCTSQKAEQKKHTQREYTLVSFCHSLPNHGCLWWWQ